MFLASGDRESVSGDLFEEYRESILPALGAGANRWYARQVGGYVLRATWPWAALAGDILVPVGTFVGTAGATVGRVAAVIYGASRPNTNSA